VNIQHPPANRRVKGNSRLAPFAIQFVRETLSGTDLPRPGGRHGRPQTAQ